MIVDAEAGLHEPIGEAIGLAIDRVWIVLFREHGAFRAIANRSGPCSSAHSAQSSRLESLQHFKTHKRRRQRPCGQVVTLPTAF
jgi:hypothetical protein